MSNDLQVETDEASGDKTRVKRPKEQKPTLPVIYGQGAFIQRFRLVILRNQHKQYVANVEEYNQPVKCLIALDIVS
jgi:hypothetical protein